MVSLVLVSVLSLVSTFLVSVLSLVSPVLDSALSLVSPVLVSALSLVSPVLVSALPLVRWYSESARWLVLNRRSEDALKSLHRVARINGKSEVIDKMTIEVTNESVLNV